MQRKLFKYKKSRFAKIEADRRATSTKRTFVYFQENDEFLKIEAARRATSTKRKIVQWWESGFVAVKLKKNKQLSDSTIQIIL